MYCNNPCHALIGSPSMKCPSIFCLCNFFATLMPHFKFARAMPYCALSPDLYAMLRSRIRIQTSPIIHGFWYGKILRCFLTVTFSVQNEMYPRTAHVYSSRSWFSKTLHSVLMKQSCNCERALSGQVQISLLMGFVCLLQGVQARIRCSDRWSDWPMCGCGNALYACLI